LSQQLEQQHNSKRRAQANKRALATSEREATHALTQAQRKISE
jgi:hypothetical protein